MILQIILFFSFALLLFAAVVAEDLYKWFVKSPARRKFARDLYFGIASRYLAFQCWFHAKAGRLAWAQRKLGGSGITIVFKN